MVTIDDLIARNKKTQNALIDQINGIASELDELRQQNDPDPSHVARLRSEKRNLSSQLMSHQDEAEKLEREKADDAEIARRQSISTPTGAAPIYTSERTSNGYGELDRTGSAGWKREDGTRAALDRTERMSEHPVVQRSIAARSTADSAVIGTHGSLDQLIRSISTSGASAVIPTAWASEVIDLARDQSATISAGAQIIPMEANKLRIGRITGDPSPAFRLEEGEITPSAPTFDSVDLEAKTMSTLVIASMEWLQDASPDGEDLITQTLSAAMAQHLDLVALYGGIETGAGTIDLESPPNPTGVLKTLLDTNSAANVLGATAGVTATNGTSQTVLTFYNELTDLVYKVKNANHEPTGIIWSPRAEQAYSKAYDSTGQPLRVPEHIASIPRYASTKIPTYTQGTLQTATDVFAGDWRQLLIGQRLDLTIQVLTERYAEFGQVGIVCHWRGDVALAQPKAFAAYKALKGA